MQAPPRGLTEARGLCTGDWGEKVAPIVVNSAFDVVRVHLSVQQRLLNLCYDKEDLLVAWTIAVMPGIVAAVR
jgi:hypothetical protein